jgi:hypothetical protein
MSRLFLMLAAYAIIAPGGTPSFLPPLSLSFSLLCKLSIPTQPHVFLRKNTAAPCVRELYL